MTYIPDVLAPERDAINAARLRARSVRALVRGSMTGVARDNALHSLTIIDEFLQGQLDDVEYRAQLLVMAATERVLDATYVSQQQTWTDEADFRESEASDHA